MVRTVVAVVRTVVLVLVMSLGMFGCDRIGDATTRIDDAEAEVDALVVELVDALDVEVESERAFGTRERCEQPGLGPGLSNTRSLRATLPDAPDAVQRTSAVLTDAGYTITDADRGEGVFARRDGIRLAVLFDPVRSSTEIDVNTGCRPAPTG